MADRPCRAARRINSARKSIDHPIVFDEAQLRRVLKKYASYYNQIGTHLSLDKNNTGFAASAKARPHRSDTNFRWNPPSA
jgi:hypothetical protein